MGIDFKLLGRRIKQIRTQQNLSQAALAEMIGCSSPFISYISTLALSKSGYHKALETPADENMFRQLRLNQWVKQSVR